MPDMSGLEVLARVRETHGPVQLPVVMVTARTDSEDVVEALGLGANDYVTKPIDLPVMLARVRAQLRIRQAAAPGVESADEARSPAEVRPGTMLAGRYLLEARIGSGTFGTVFRAKHVELGQAVAIKVLQASANANPDSLARFRREGITACRVKHPNAVQVMDFGVTPGGVAYLVMELLSGYSLDQELIDGRKVPLPRTVRIMVPVCEALAAAHRFGIVHRDVKPANIFLHLAGGEEVPKVLDFGIARIVGEAAADPRVTLDGLHRRHAGVHGARALPQPAGGRPVGRVQRGHHAVPDADRAASVRRRPGRSDGGGDAPPRGGAAADGRRRAARGGGGGDERPAQESRAPARRAAPRPGPRPRRGRTTAAAVRLHAEEGQK